MLEFLFNKFSDLQHKCLASANNCCCISEIQSTKNPIYFTHKPKTLFSFLVFIKYFLTSSALQTLVSPNLCLLSRLSCMLNICKSSFSSSLNKLNALSPYQIFVPIGNAQNLISGFI